MMQPWFLCQCSSCDSRGGCDAFNDNPSLLFIFIGNYFVSAAKIMREGQEEREENQEQINCNLVQQA